MYSLITNQRILQTIGMSKEAYSRNNFKIFPFLFSGWQAVVFGVGVCSRLLQPLLARAQQLRSASLQSQLYQRRMSGHSLFLLASIHPVTSCRAGFYIHLCHWAPSRTVHASKNKECPLILPWYWWLWLLRKILVSVNFQLTELHVLTVDRISYWIIKRTDPKTYIYLAQPRIHWAKMHIILIDKCVLIYSQNGVDQHVLQWNLDTTITIF